MKRWQDMLIRLAVKRRPTYQAGMAALRQTIIARAEGGDALPNAVRKSA